MTREEAIKVLEFFKGQAEKYDGSLEYIKPEEVEAFSMAIDALKQTAWIPVGERLPDEPFPCIVTIMDENAYTGEMFENILFYFVGYDGEQWNDDDGLQCPYEVLAWMPLPEPYKGGDNE